ncbi:hypothetical protein SRB17_47020 [Streptomyces sp. RB17]|nr:hypothetical protein [Streptomyces sp. RB17]
MEDKAALSTTAFDFGVVHRHPDMPRAPREPRSDPLAFTAQAVLLGHILDLSLTGARSRREAEAEAYGRYRFPYAG